MTARKGLVLDANILLRAVFGQRVRQILEAYEDQANFYTGHRPSHPTHGGCVEKRS